MLKFFPIHREKVIHHREYENVEKYIYIYNSFYKEIDYVVRNKNRSICITLLSMEILVLNKCRQIQTRRLT